MESLGKAEQAVYSYRLEVNMEEDVLELESEIEEKQTPKYGHAKRGGKRTKKGVKLKPILFAPFYLVYYGENGEIKIPFLREWTLSNVQDVISLVKDCITPEVIMEKEDGKLKLSKRYNHGGQVTLGVFFLEGENILWEWKEGLKPNR